METVQTESYTGPDRRVHHLLYPDPGGATNVHGSRHIGRPSDHIFFESIENFERRRELQ